MANDATASFEALRRVEFALRQSERQQANQRRVMDLLTTIAETLEATKCTPKEPRAEALSSLPLFFTPTYTAECDMDLAQQQMTSAELGVVLHTMARVQHSVTAALARLSWRVQIADEHVQRLSAAVRNRAVAVDDIIEKQQQKSLLETASLAVLATVVHLGSVDGNSTGLEKDQAEECYVTMPQIPVCSAVMQSTMKKNEEAISEAIRCSADVYQSAAETTCRLLRFTLLEKLSSQRWFPSPEVCRSRREIQASWRSEVKEAALRQKMAQKNKWKRHECLADAVAKDEWS